MHFTNEVLLPNIANMLYVTSTQYEINLELTEVKLSAKLGLNSLSKHFLIA